MHDTALVETEVKTLELGDVRAWYDKIRSDSLEMGRLKSDVDIEYFTVSSVGPFICHQFHMLMRQYSLALLELERMLIDREQYSRRIDFLETEREDPVNSFYPDLEIRRAQLQIDNLDLSIRNKFGMCKRFEEYRTKLIELNGGEFTDDQYQTEEPGYWSWYFENMLQHYQLQSATGVPEGVWKNLSQLNQEPLLLEKINKSLEKAYLSSAIKQLKQEPVLES